MTKVYRRTVEIKKTDLPEGLIEKLKILNGLPPHNTMSNIAWNDGYFAKSIENTYGADMVQAAYELVIKPLQDGVASASERIEELEGLLREARKIIRSSNARNLGKDWYARATAALAKGE